jgi:hypothetical protein
MITAKHCKEISLSVTNDVGILAKITKIITEKGINILAACAWVENANKGIIHLVTEDNLRVMDALRAHNYSPEELASIAVELNHKPGMLNRVCTKLSTAHVGIHYLYVSAPINEDQCLLVLSTEDNDKALIALND